MTPTSPRQNSAVALGCALALLCFGASSAFAQSFTFPDFSSNQNTLQLNGNAAFAPGAVAGDGTVLRVTPATFSQAGSAFSKTQIALQNNASFSTEFTFRITDSGGAGDNDGPGADGIVFAVQSVSNNVGSNGGGIGFLGIPNSLGVEFDTWNNGFGFGDQNNGNHVAINVNGNLTDFDLTNIPTRMNNGALWYAWVDYNGTNDDLEVRLSQTSTRPSGALIQTNAFNLTSILGQTNAYVGFTSGTGAAFGNHDITSWQFNDTFQPVQHVSAPDTAGTLSLFGLSLAALAALARRRKLT